MPKQEVFDEVYAGELGLEQVVYIEDPPKKKFI